MKRLTTKIRHVRTHGFTLIEMVVVVGLMLLMLGGSIAGYRKFNDRQLVQQAGKGFVSALRDAQKRASVGDKPQAGCTKLDGYKLKATALTNSYIVTPVCDGAEVVASAATYTMPADVTFPQDVSVQFNVLSRGTVVSGSSGGVATLSLQDNQGTSGYAYQVKVSTSGEVTEIGLVTGGITGVGGGGGGGFGGGGGGGLGGFGGGNGGAGSQ